MSASSSSREWFRYTLTVDPQSDKAKKGFILFFVDPTTQKVNYESLKQRIFSICSTSQRDVRDFVLENSKDHIVFSFLVLDYEVALANLKPLLDIVLFDAPEHSKPIKVAQFKVEDNLDILKEAHKYGELSHEAKYSSCQANIAPFRGPVEKGRSTLMVQVDFHLLLAASDFKESWPDKIEYMCSLWTTKESAPAGKILLGVSKIDNNKKIVAVEDNVGLSATLGVNPSLSPSYQRSRTVTSEVPDFNVIETVQRTEENGRCSQYPNTLAVEFQIKELKKNPQVIRKTVIFSWDIAEVPPSDIQFYSCWMFTNTSWGRSKVHRSFMSSVLRYDVSAKPAKEAAVTVIIGFPKSGKSSLLDEIFNLHGRRIPVLQTPNLTKYKLNLGANSGASKTYAFLDTLGYYFNVTDQQDQVNLKRLISGLPDGTAFSRFSDLQHVPKDGTNAISHVVLVINARDAYKGVLWWKQWVEQNSLSARDQMKDFVGLYDFVYNELANSRYFTDPIQTQGKIAILVTHFDMIPAKEKSRVKTEITSMFEDKKIPKSLIVFGEKGCSWEEQDLLDHEKKVAEFLAKVPEDKDYYTFLEEEKKPPTYLHILPTYCKTPDCNHEYTPKTQDSYKKFIDVLLSPGSN